TPTATPSSSGWTASSAAPTRRASGRSRSRRSAASGRRRSHSDAVDVEDALDPADGGEDVVEVRPITHLEDEPGLGDAGPRGGDGRGQDVDVQLGEHARDVGQQPRAVERLDLDVDEVQ